MAVDRKACGRIFKGALKVMKNLQKQTLCQFHIDFSLKLILGSAGKMYLRVHRIQVFFVYNILDHC